MGQEKGDWKDVTAEIKDKGRDRERVTIFHVSEAGADINMI